MDARILWFLVWAGVVVAAVLLRRRAGRSSAPPRTAADPLGLRAAVDRLDTGARRHLEGAAARAQSEAKPTLDVEHWVLVMAEAPDAELARLWRFLEVVPSLLAAELRTVLAQRPASGGPIPTLHADTIRLIHASYRCAESEFRAPKAAPSHVLYALFLDEDLLRSFGRVESLRGVTAAAIRRWILERGAETGATRADPAGG